MSDTPLHVLIVVGSPGLAGATRTVLHHLRDQLLPRGVTVDVLDLGQSPLPLFNPETTYQAEYYAALQQRARQADVFLVGTPDYHGSMSGTLKNFFDHLWPELAGKLVAPVVASHDKGLTVTDQVRTVARQCYAWCMPYALAFADKQDVVAGQVTGEAFVRRLEMFARDLAVYGRLLAAQRRADLAGTEPGFLSRHRS